ncbi:MAG: LamG domain-containing protein [Aquimonas sp.]|nr:LamG domain-containing protein [Aquimonas sp.]
MRFLTVASAVLALVLAAPAAAQLTVVAEYRMGEDDVGAVIGGPGAAQTQPGAAGSPLQQFGAPVYGAGGTPRGRTSTLSMRFDGSSARYGGPALAMPTDNFGVEAWARSNSTTGNAMIVYNGNSATSGFGLFRSGANWAFLYGGIVIGGSTPVTPGWTHLAIVRDAGVNRFFVNGIQVSTSGEAPNPPAGALNIGGNNLLATEFFDGEIDEVRLFTFAPGAFSPSLLNTAERPAMPVPSLTLTGSALLALVLALLGVFALRSRS